MKFIACIIILLISLSPLADCVDLSGHYRCYDNVTISISQENDSGTEVYTLNFRGMANWQAVYTTDGRTYASDGSKAFCDSSRLRVYDPHYGFLTAFYLQGRYLRVNNYSVPRNSNLATISTYGSRLILSTFKDCTRM